MTPQPPPLDYALTVEVDVDPPVTIGRTIDGTRRVVPIRGGVVRGPGIEGRILDIGADFQQYPEDEVACLRADYVLELGCGHRILMQNRALRTGSAEDLRKMMSAAPVDPSRIYFRCVPRLTADVAGPFNWMNRTLFVGTGERRPSGVRVDVFRVG